jgi:hypothetical protein
VAGAARALPPGCRSRPISLAGLLRPSMSRIPLAWVQRSSLDAESASSTRLRQLLPESSNDDRDSSPIQRNTRNTAKSSSCMGAWRTILRDQFNCYYQDIKNDPAFSASHSLRRLFLANPIYKRRYTKLPSRFRGLAAIGNRKPGEAPVRAARLGGNCALVYRLAYSDDIVAFKMGRRQGGPSRTGVWRAHI